MKQARNLIAGNTIIGANKNGMSSRAGFANRFQGNTVLDAYMGVVIRWRDHEVTGNRFERCRRAAVCLMDAKPNGDGFAAENTLVERNTMLDCGGADMEPCAAVNCAGILLFTPAANRSCSTVAAASGR